MPRLSGLKVGDQATIASIKCEGALKSRLIAMGIAQGERCKIIGKSARGATLEIMIGDNRLALRRAEANAIEAAA